MTGLSVGSTFTGIGGADLGLEWAGFRVAWQCELDPWKRSVLAAHWPEVPIYDDIRTLDIQRGSSRSAVEGTIGDANGIAYTEVVPVDVLIGGFPCQDLSVAGKRKGFSGERSVLAFEFLRVAESLRPRWLILENVPGLLSSNRGADFARLIDEVVGCGYGVAWRILDARYFGVPQRRRRVFIVARRADSLGDTRAAGRLALRALIESGSGDSTPGWPPRQETTGGVGAGAPSDSGKPIAFYTKGGGQEGFARADGVLQTLTKIADTGISIAFRKSKRAQTDRDDETWVDDGAANTLNRFDLGDTRTTHAVVDTASTLQANQTGGVRMDAEGAAGGHLVPDETTVRRLTPVECERLMGLPDNWTAPEGVKAPDSKRYAACGDAIVTWVAYWIGQRIRMIEEEA